MTPNSILTTCPLFRGKIRNDLCEPYKLAEWKSDYNKTRPHSSLGGLSPLEFAAQWSSTNPQTVEFLNQKTV
jgi:hypothetical protein